MMLLGSVAILASHSPKKTMNAVVSTLPTLEDIRETIKNRPRRIELADIAATCGVSVEWLSKLLAGNIDNPGYSRIKAVVDFVTAG